MTHDQVVIVLNTAAWSGGVGLAGGVLLWFGRRSSVRWLTVGVATTAVLAVVAGTVGGLLAIVGLVIGKVAFVDRVLAGVFEAAIVPRVGYADIFSVAPILLLVGAVVAALTGYVTLRLYVRT